MKINKIKVWAVIDKNGDLLHRESGSYSIFKSKKIAHFLAYDWADPQEELQAVRCELSLTPENIRKEQS